MTDPSLSAGDQATIIGVGAAVLLGTAGGLWRAASLRGDVHARWKKRVDFAVARLDELIVTELQVLRDETAALLPGPHNFDPALVVADPVLLTERAGHVAKIYKIRQRMESDLARSRAVGPALIVALAMIALGTLAATAYYGEVFHDAPLRVIALLVLSLGTALLVMTSSIYAFFQHRLSSGEIEAGTDIKESQITNG